MSWSLTGVPGLSAYYYNSSNYIFHYNILIRTSIKSLWGIPHFDKFYHILSFPLPKKKTKQNKPDLLFTCYQTLVILENWNLLCVLNILRYSLTVGSLSLIHPSERYEDLKSWSHWDTQCASSIATSVKPVEQINIKYNYL